MPIVQFDPFRNNLFSLQKKIFEPFFEDNDNWPELTMTQGLNVYEEDDSVIIKAAVPGIPQDKLNITYEDGVLHINGIVEENEEEKKKKKVVYKRQMITSVDYTTYLPRAINADSIKAKIKDGVITITAPIAPEAKPKKITISS